MAKLTDELGTEEHFRYLVEVYGTPPSIAREIVAISAGRYEGDMQKVDKPTRTDPSLLEPRPPRQLRKPENSK